MGQHLFLASSVELQQVLLPRLPAAALLRLGLSCRALLSWIMSCPATCWQVGTGLAREPAAASQAQAVGRAHGHACPAAGSELAGLLDFRLCPQALTPAVLTRTLPGMLRLHIWPLCLLQRVSLLHCRKAALLGSA